ncbi:hypothetical protein LH20_03875 [Sphingopyxis sp. 113P3]|nr:hypothetical protein LH20_03875 [Sphingopyxis sp. 113P3]
MTHPSKAIVITGASSGIGAAVAARFLADGYGVVALNRSAASSPSGPDNEHYVPVLGDVRSMEDNQRAVAIALERFGRLNVFIGNAGVYDHKRRFETYDEAELAQAFDELFGINVKGYMLGARAAAPALKASNGSIIFTSSISGSIPGFGGALYVAAKHAITGLTRQLALELAPDVRVNAVAPGYVPTQLRGLESMAQKDAVATGPQEANMPLRRFGELSDFAEAYLFLASAARANLASGTILTLDGGVSMRGSGAPGPIAG